MKKIIIFGLFSFSLIFSQISSTNGYDLPPFGTIRIFVVFAEIINSPSDNCVDSNKWPRGSMPLNAGTFFEHDVANVSNNCMAG